MIQESVWQLDLGVSPLESSQRTWGLWICDAEGSFRWQQEQLRVAVNRAWLQWQLHRAIAKAGTPPEAIEVFRPSILPLIQQAAHPLGIPVQPRRHPLALKGWLRELAAAVPGWDPLSVAPNPPEPVPETLKPDFWQFAALKAGELVNFVTTHPIPFQCLPPDRSPLALGLASTDWIPGVILQGGRQSRALGQWLEQRQPACLNYVPGTGDAPHGLILEAGLNDRWVMATFEDAEVIKAGRTFQNRLSISQGLHFLLLQPDDTGVTYTGFWLLQRDAEVLTVLAPRRESYAL